MVTFFHDHVFIKHKDKYYTSGSLTKEVMVRYTEPFGRMRLVTRQREVTDIYTDLQPSNVLGTEFIEVPNYKSISSMGNYFKARKIIKEEVKNAEFIVLRTSSIANIAGKYARKFRKPYLVEVVGCAWDGTWNYSLLGKLIAPISYIMQKKTVKNADFAIYVTNDYLQKKYPNKNKTTNCSNVALNEFNERVLQERLKKIEAKKLDEKIIIGTTAAVNVRYKGQEYIIKALAKLKEQGLHMYEYQLVGGGDQSYLKEIAQKYGVSDQLKFLGKMTHDKVYEWLDTIDIYAQPSRQEGLPRSVIEAMSRAVPAIGANTAGIPELLDSDVIFSNTKANTNEISDIIINFDQKKMKAHARKNYLEAKKYDKSIIESRRRQSFKKYIEYNR